MRSDYTDRLDKAMWNEPEALTPDQLGDLIDGKERQARARVDSFKSTTLAGIEALAVSADLPTYRKLRNVRRATEAL
jgi:hypothetical protein